MVFGQNGCVHRVLRSILSQKRPGRLTRIFDFSSAIFWSFSDIYPGTEYVNEQFLNTPNRTVM